MREVEIYIERDKEKRYEGKYERKGRVEFHSQ